MACEHLIKLYKYREDNKIEISSSELINFICQRCKIKDACQSYMPKEFYEKYR